MFTSDKEAVKARMLAVLKANRWGTIGADSIAAAAEIVSRTAGNDADTHAVLCDSPCAALETAIRGLLLGHGDKIAVGSSCSSYIIGTVRCSGAEPVLYGVCADCGKTDIATLRAQLEAGAAAVITEDKGAIINDYSAICALCNEFKAKLIVCSEDAFGLLYNGKSTVLYADAAVADFSEGSAIDADCAAVITTTANYSSIWSTHHCGNTYNRGSFHTSDTVGGDMRVCEWKSALLLCKLESGK